MNKNAYYCNALADDAIILTVVKKQECYHIQVRDSECKFVIHQEKLGNTPPPKEGDRIGLFYHSDKRFAKIIAAVELRETMLYMLSLKELEEIKNRISRR